MSLTCQKDLMAKGVAYPRTCQDCGLGTCKKGYDSRWTPANPVGKGPAWWYRQNPNTSQSFKLPEWGDCSAKDDAKQELDPLERFIYENTPAGKDEEEKFRAGLTAVIQYVQPVIKPPEQPT